MEAILALQKKLQEVQNKKSKSTLKLNERNVVDIVLKLVADSHLKLIYTSDGKEYLTPEQVTSEIISLVDENGGRLSLQHVCSHLALNYEVVEQTAH